MDFEFGTIDYIKDNNLCRVEISIPTPLFEQLLTYIYQTCNTLANNKPYYLVTVFKAEVQPTKEAYSFFASKNRTVNVIKEAFILNSSSIKLAANFYFRVIKPHVPGKAFDDENEAKNWLLK